MQVRVNVKGIISYVAFVDKWRVQCCAADNTKQIKKGVVRDNPWIALGEFANLCQWGAEEVRLVAFELLPLDIGSIRH